MTDALKVHFIEDVAFDPDIPALMQHLRIKEGSARAADFNRLLDEALPIGRPRALLMDAYVNDRGDNWVVIGDRRFDSRVLRVNLDEAHRVFPYLATCGPELQDWTDQMNKSVDDMVLSFWAESIKEAALYSAANALTNYLQERLYPGKTAFMNPGSLEDWPLTQQRVLFDLIGSGTDQVGVRLTDSMLMVPNKSVSGIIYPTEVDFASCQLCPREICPNRRAPYDAELYNRKYNLHNN